MDNGTYIITYFLDKDRQPTDKETAVHFEIHEYDINGVETQRTYA
jgi:hypothetical protein